MNRIAVITDSTADLPPAIRGAHGITVVPLTVTFGDESFRDQIDLTTDAFVARLLASDIVPTTSQPSAGVFETTFRALAADHDAIVAVLISSRLSGTVESASVARDAVAGLIPVEVVDSENASMGLGFQAIAAAEMAATGALGAAEIAGRLRASVRGYETLFYVDTLEYLRRGGRVNRVSALVGSLLDLKPMLRIDEGQVIPVERTRTRSRARAALVDFVRGLPHVERLAIVHVSTPADAEALAGEFDLTVARDKILITQLGPVIGTHVGPGTMGVIVDTGSLTA
ncbi:MAG: DegV family protein [Thermomicrobiales bacterium]